MRTYRDPRHPDLRGHDELIAKAHKSVPGTTLELVVDCYADHATR
jgi:hypothetical protein